MVPASVGVAAFQLNVVITYGFAFFVDPQIIAAFDYAVRLMELPQGVFGISMATYLLPTLSGLAVDKKYPEFRSTLTKALEHLLFVNLLAAVLLAVLAVPIIRLLFERGRFDAFATGSSALALGFLAPGLIAYASVNVLARAFYALGDTNTPMRISVTCLAINLLLSLTFIFPLQQAGLGLANSMTAFLQCGLLIYALRRKLPKTDFADLRGQLPRLMLCMAVAGGVAYGLLRLWDARLGHAGWWLKVGEVFVPMTAATLVYGVMAWSVRIPSALEMTRLVLPGRPRP
jgi:putative peptidoglycan lipid II flippase